MSLSSTFGKKSSQEEFHDITHHLQKVGFKANFISGLMMPILNGISDLTYLIIALMGGLQVIAGRFDCREYAGLRSICLAD